MPAAFRRRRQWQVRRKHQGGRPGIALDGQVTMFRQRPVRLRDRVATSPRNHRRRRGGASPSSSCRNPFAENTSGPSPICGRLVTIANAAALNGRVNGCFVLFRAAGRSQTLSVISSHTRPLASPFRHPVRSKNLMKASNGLPALVARQRAANSLSSSTRERLCSDWLYRAMPRTIGERNVSERNAC